MRQPQQRTYRKKSNSQINEAKLPIEPKNINLTNNEKDNQITNKGEEAKSVTPKISSNNKKDWQPRIANLIAFGALIISGILAIYTYKVFQIANSQSESVIKAANASVDGAKTAKKTLDETKRYNREYLKLQQNLFVSGNEDSKKRFKRDSFSLDAQIQSIKENKNEFEIENVPNLQMGDTKVAVFKDDSAAKFKSNLYNLTKHPIKAISIKLAIYGRDRIDSAIFIKNAFNYPINQLLVSDYIDPQKPTEINFYSPILPKGTVNGFINRDYLFFIVVIIKYKNYINNKNRIYKCIINCIYNPETRIDFFFLYNENKDEK